MNRAVAGYLLVLAASCGLDLEALESDANDDAGVTSASGSSGSASSSSGSVASSSSGGSSGASSSSGVSTGSSGSASGGSSSGSSSGTPPIACNLFEGVGAFCGSDAEHAQCDGATNEGDHIVLPSKPVAVGCNSVSVLQGAVMAPDSLPADTFRVRAELTVLTQKRPVIVLVLGTTPPDPSADPCAQFSDKDQFVLLYRSGESWKVQLQNKGECTLPTSPDAITAVETDTKLLVQVNRDGPELSMTWKEDGGAWSPLSHLVSTLGSDAKLSLVAYHPANTKTEQNSVHLTKLSLCPQGD